MSLYDETIRLYKDSDEFRFLTSHSALLEGLSDSLDTDKEGKEYLELSADILFDGDQERWKDFVDVFFPEISGQRYFGFKNGKVYVLEERGGKEKLAELLDFFLVDRPETMMNFAREQAKKQLNVAQNVVPRGVGITTTGVGAQEYAARQAAAQRNNVSNYGNNNGNYNNNNYNNNNNNNNIAIGYTEEEEEALGKIKKGSNIRKYFPNQRRSTRRTRRRRNNMLRKKTRRGNRK